MLAMSADAQFRRVLTSRNAGLALRRAVSSRNPDLLKANGGGSNAILVRGEIAAHRAVRLTWWPERRWAHGVRLADGSWAVKGTKKDKAKKVEPTATYWGTCWAVIGLAETLPRAK